MMRASELREQGIPFWEIGAELGVSTQTALNDCRRWEEIRQRSARLRKRDNQSWEWRFMLTVARFSALADDLAIREQMRRRPSPDRHRP
jgi:hypothetical protein